MNLSYDVPAWLASPNGDDLRQPCRYLVALPGTTVQRIANIVNMSKNLELSLQILFRDGGSGDLWPLWQPTDLQPTI